MTSYKQISLWFTNNIISMKCCVWPSNINIVYELPWCIACSSGPSSNNWYNLLRLNTENCKFHFSPISFELAVSLQIFVCMVWFFYLLCAVVNILFKIYVFSRPIKNNTCELVFIYHLLFLWQLRIHIYKNTTEHKCPAKSNL